MSFLLRKFKKLYNFNKTLPSIDIYNPLQSFNVLDVDAQIKTKVLEYIAKNKIELPVFESSFDGRVGFLASNFYDVGGHTECVKNIVNAIHMDYELGIFLSRLKLSESLSPTKTKILKSRVAVFDGTDSNLKKDIKATIELYRKIIEFRPRVIITFMHMNDSVSAAVLAMIREFTDIKVFYFDHGGHYPALGYGFAHLSIECTYSAKLFSQKYRGIKDCRLMSLPSSFITENKKFERDQINKVREEWGLRNEDLCTLTGGAAYKFFDSPNRSRYFEMIRDILLELRHLKHIVISNFNHQQLELIDKIFSEEGLKKRLVIRPLGVDYELLFKACDLFIDTIPIGAALTQVDLMRLKVPSVVHINVEKPECSFHEYMPEEYPYMSSDISEIKKYIFLLINDADERRRIAEENYKFFLNRYEGRAIRKQYKELIENNS